VKRVECGRKSGIKVTNPFVQFNRNVSNLAVISAAILTCSVLIGGVAYGQTTRIPHGTLELVSENTAVVPGQEFTVGLQFRMEKGWHIYWVNPGDSGEPPHVTWTLPKGLTAGEIMWPAPRRMGASTIVNYVYDGDVLLMLPVRAGADYSASSSDKLQASVRFLICSEQMCVPGKAQLSLAIPVKAQGKAGASLLADFAAARARLPKTPPESWKFSGRAEKDSFVIDVQAGHSISQGSFFPLHESQIDNAAAQVVSARPTGMRVTLHKSGELTKPLSSLKGVLELPGGESYLVDVPMAPPARRQSAFSQP
jgi:DsbC/DsbD-like thiol-disulfide interchange protein